MTGARQKQRPEDRQLRRRVAWLGAVLFLAGLGVSARLIDLQVIRREIFARRAQQQHEHAVIVPAHRGRILDREGRPLAESLEVPSLYADTRGLEDPVGAADRLAPILGVRRSRLRRQLSTPRSFVYLARWVSPDIAEQALALKIPGVQQIMESRRFYPAGRMASHVIGVVGIEGTGLEGAEYLYDERIGAHPGRIISVRDARGTSVLRYLELPSSSGEDLQLTLDSVIQYHAEVELDRAMKQTRSRRGSVIVMDPGTGAVLALANRPSFNPNELGRDQPQRNHAVEEFYEPGSTFKVIVAAAALEEGITHPDEVIHCGHGSIEIARRTIRDHKIFDDLTFAQVLSESSNVGAIKIGLRLSPEKFDGYVRAFGFGERTGIGLPAEGRGLVHSPDRWSGRSQASMSMGQEIGTTPLQVLRAFAAIANDGVLPYPYIVADARPDTPGKRVVSSETARTLNRMLEGVVDHGTGKLAAVPGYRIAGKTGTAQKAEGKQGYGDNHVASFAGYAPAREPALAILVVLDSPRGKYHGGEIAAPVFARVVMPALRRLGVLPDRSTPEAPSVQMARVQATHQEPGPMPEPLTPRAEGEPVVPDLSGSTLRDALAQLALAGLGAQVKGSGRVVGQTPAGGSVVAEGTVVRVLLSRNRRPEGGAGKHRGGRAGAR